MRANPEYNVNSNSDGSIHSTKQLMDFIGTRLREDVGSKHVALAICAEGTLPSVKQSGKLFASQRLHA